MGGLDILDLNQPSQHKVQPAQAKDSGILDLLGGGDLLSLGSTSDVQMQPSPAISQSQGMISGLDFSGLTSPPVTAAPRMAQSPLVSDGLDLLGGISGTQQSPISMAPAPVQQRSQDNAMNLLDDDLLGGGLSSGPSKALEFLGYEDNLVTIRFKCSKVVIFYVAFLQHDQGGYGSFF